MDMFRKDKRFRYFFEFILLFFIFLTLFAGLFHNHSILEEHHSDCIVFTFVHLFFLATSFEIFKLIFQLFVIKIRDFYTEENKAYDIIKFYPTRSPPVFS